MRVLFIGNSHTYYNEMPQIFKTICESCGADTEVAMLAHGGKGWEFHVDQPEVRFNILYGNYDVVVLQHNAHPMGSLDIMKAAGEQLIRLIKDAGARPVLYMTWTAKEDGAAKQPEMSKIYREIGSGNHCAVAPVGDVWWKYHEMNPDAELYAEDGHHASPIGSRIAAFTLACIALNKTPLEMSHKKGIICDMDIVQALDAVIKNIVSIKKRDKQEERR